MPWGGAAPGCLPAAPPHTHPTPYGGKASPCLPGFWRVLGALPRSDGGQLSASYFSGSVAQLPPLGGWRSTPLANPLQRHPSAILMGGKMLSFLYFHGIELLCSKRSEGKTDRWIQSPEARAAAPRRPWRPPWDAPAGAAAPASICQPASCPQPEAVTLVKCAVADHPGRAIG